MGASMWETLSKQRKWHAINTYAQQDWKTVIYENTRAEARLHCRKMNHKSWEAFVKRTDQDMTGEQWMSFKLLKKLACEKNSNAWINLMSEEEWIKYYMILLYKDSVGLMNIRHMNVIMLDQSKQATACEKLKEAIKGGKNRKSDGLDGFPMELWKYSGKQRNS